MRIKIIDYGYEHLPKRVHYNDAGADVFAKDSAMIMPNTVHKMPLGFGIELPDGFMANIYPRSGNVLRGIITQIPPIDSGYTGEIFALVYNSTSDVIFIDKGERIGQLVVTPILLPTFVDVEQKKRGDNGFNSTGK